MSSIADFASQVPEDLTSKQLALLRRFATAGRVSILSIGGQKALDELIAKKLVLGNQLTDAGWSELRKARGSLDGLIPFALSKPKIG